MCIITYSIVDHLSRSWLYDAIITCNNLYTVLMSTPSVTFLIYKTACNALA